MKIRENGGEKLLLATRPEALKKVTGKIFIRGENSAHSTEQQIVEQSSANK